MLKPESSGGTDSSDLGVCGREIRGKFSTNLKQHLKVAHPEQYSAMVRKETEQKEVKLKQQEVKKKKSLKYSQQMTLEQSLQSKVKYSPTNDRYRLITRKLALFIGTSNVPNSLVENLEFCDLLNTGMYHLAGLL